MRHEARPAHEEPARGSPGLESCLYAVLLFGPAAFGAVEPWSLGLVEAGVFCLFASLLVRGLVSTDNGVWRSVLPAVLGVLALAALQRSNPSHADLPRSLAPSTVDALATGRALALWSCYAAFLIVASHALEGWRSRHQWAWFLFIAGLLVALVGLAQAPQGNRLLLGFRPVGEWHLAFATYYNRNHAASVMVMGALAGFGIFLSRLPGLRRERIGETADQVSVLLLVLMLVAVIVAGIVVSGSRGGLHALVLGLLVAAALAAAGAGRRIRWLALAMGLCGACAYALFLLRYRSYVSFLPQEPVGPADFSWAWRLSMFAGAWQMLKDFPLTGLGLGAFAAAFPAYQAFSLMWRVEHAHNDWLELAVETGGLGFVLLVAGFLLLIARTLRAWRSLERPDQRLLCAGMFGACAAFVAHGLVEFNFHIPANAMLFLALLCWLGSIAAVPSGGFRPSPRFAVWPLALASGLMAVSSLRGIGLSWRIHQAGTAPPAEAAALLGKALAWGDSPDIHHRMSLSLGKEAVQAGAVRSRLIFLEALRHENAALSADPLHQRYLEQRAWLLSRLGRPADG